MTENANANPVGNKNANLTALLNNNSKHQDEINWDTIIALAVFHALAVVALFYFSWANLVAALVMWWIAGSLGIGVGYHRLLTHRSFKTPKALEYFFAFCGTLAVQSGAVKWVTTHRIHHAYTETEHDPHSPRNGSYWAHIGWIMQGTSQEHDEAVIQRYAPDLGRDRVHRWLSDYYIVPTVIVAAILFAIGGWTMVLWGVFLRVVWGWHTTWLVNSATHMWGSRRFETHDDSTNNALVALVSFGEGWHNNHHAQPSSAKHGLAWYEVDVNWITIRLLETVGLAKQIRVYKLKDQKNELEQAA